MKTPRIIQSAVLVASGVAFLAVLATLGLNLASLSRGWQLQNYFMLSFDVVILAMCVFGIGAGLGKFRSGPALAVLCVGGAIFVGTVLSEPSVVVRALRGTGGPGLRFLADPNKPGSGIPFAWFFAARLACALALIGLSGVIVLGRRPRESVTRLVRGAMLLVPVFGIGAAIVLPGPRGVVMGFPPLVGMFVAIVAFFIVCGFLAAGVHQIIRAFEVGIDAHEREVGSVSA